MNIGGNAFRSLLECVFGLTNLAELRASDNPGVDPPVQFALIASAGIASQQQQPQGAPQSVGGLRELRQIDLRGNRLSPLPAAMARLPRLDQLVLRWASAPPEPARIGVFGREDALVYRLMRPEPKQSALRR